MDLEDKAFQKWNKFADSASFYIQINTVLEHTDLNEGDDIADLIMLLRQENYSSSPKEILDKLIVKNPLLNTLIKTFDLGF